MWLRPDGGMSLARPWTKLGPVVKLYKLDRLEKRYETTVSFWTEGEAASIAMAQIHTITGLSRVVDCDEEIAAEREHFLGARIGVIRLIRYWPELPDLGGGKLAETIMALQGQQEAAGSLTLSSAAEDRLLLSA